MTKRLVAAAALVAIVAVAGLLSYEFVLARPGPCMPLGGAKPVESTARSNTFGAVTEYALPNPGRWANGITVAADGSVWFGEESVPGVGHLFGNGTLVEYPWPSAAKPSSNACGYRTGIWGVALWNGMVWGADFDESSLVGLNPHTGATTVLNLTARGVYPYTLAISPDGSLWFTSLSNKSVLGEVAPDLAVTVFGVNVPKGDLPAELQFVNATSAYFVAIDPATDSGGVFTFNPESVTTTVNPVQVGAGFQLLSPNSVSVSGGIVWVTQHYPSSIASYDLASGLWSLYPTSTENFTTTTLPYFVDANGSNVWFNEHYANRIALIDTTNETLTEYSEANPPINNGSDIQNDLTIATARGGLWFTSTTGDYIGFVNASYGSAFAIAHEGSDSASVAAGQSTTFKVAVSGMWSAPLRVQVSDSEGITGVPKLITVSAGMTSLPPGGGRTQLQVTVGTTSTLKPGRYTVAVTVTDGLVYQSAYLFLTVT